MLIIENFLESVTWPGPYHDLDVANNYIKDSMANCFYDWLMWRGNAIFDTYGMWREINGLELYNCLLSHYTEKEDYRRCNQIKKWKEQYIRLVGYFDRCRREKLERFRNKKRRA